MRVTLDYGRTGLPVELPDHTIGPLAIRPATPLPNPDKAVEEAIRKPIGPLTIQSMRQARGRVLAIEAGKTIVIDQEETVQLAERWGITIVAR